MMAWDEWGNWFEEKEREPTRRAQPGEERAGQVQAGQVQAGQEQTGPEFSPLIEAFRNQLLACLEECAGGRLGLFSDREYLESGAWTNKDRPWPEAAQLRQLAFGLQSILAQQEQVDRLCDQFLDLCSIHGESDPGEPRLARAFLNEIEASRT